MAVVVAVAQPAVVVQSFFCPDLQSYTYADYLPLGSTHTAVLRGSQQN